MNRPPWEVIDLRRLAPPQPMQRVLDALQHLPRGEHLVAMTPLYPAPLLDMLETDGFVWRTEQLALSHCWLAICHRDSAELLDSIGLPAGS